MLRIMYLISLIVLGLSKFKLRPLGLFHKKNIMNGKIMVLFGRMIPEKIIRVRMRLKFQADAY